MSRITPIRKIKEGAKGSFYEGQTACGIIKIVILDGEDGYPIRLTAQAIKGGCEANLETVQRLITLMFEMNARAECIIEQLNKVVCQNCRSQFIKGNKEIALSCAKAIARALEKHLENGNK